MRLRWITAVLVIVSMVGVFMIGRLSAENGSARNANPHVASKGFSHFKPLSASYATTDYGWALGTATCHLGRECLVLQATVDGGHAWTPVVLPASLIKAAGRTIQNSIAALLAQADGTGLRVYFANRQDGWIYGTLPYHTQPGSVYGMTNQVVIWSTHDGGSHWGEVHLSWINPQGSILDLEASGPTAYLMAWAKGFHVALAKSVVGTDNWQLDAAPSLGVPAGGGAVVGQLLLRGSKGWLIEGNDRGIIGSDQLDGTGHWVTWRPPCSSNDDADGLLAAASGSDLVTVCSIGGYGGYVSPGGPPGAVLASNWLYVSRDGGATFHAVSHLPQPVFFQEEALAYLEPGVIFAGGQGTSGRNLLGSFDGGRQWQKVYAGQALSLTFTSAAQGYSVIQDSKGNGSLIMTFDGGRNWERVPF